LYWAPAQAPSVCRAQDSAKPLRYPPDAHIHVAYFADGADAETRQETPGRMRLETTKDE
jgi:hypothetical protein